MHFLGLAKQKAPSWVLTSLQQGLKVSVQEAKEPGHLPAASNQAIQVFGQMDQLHLQSGCAEKVICEPHQSATSVPARLIRKLKLPGGDSHRCCVDSGSAQAEGVCTAGEQADPKLHPQG